MNRRVLPAAVIVLLLALLLGAGWWWLGGGGGDDAALDGGAAALAGADEGGDAEPLPALGTEGGEARLPAPGEPGYEEPAKPSPGSGAAGGESGEGEMPGETEREERADRYTRKSLRYRARSSTNRLPPTGQPVPVHELRLVFEDGSPVKGAAMFHNGRSVGKTDETGYLSPLPVGPIDWYARAKWLWLGRRLWFKEHRDGPRGQSAYVQVMWSAGRQLAGVLRDRTGGPVAGAVLTFVQDLPNRRVEWTSTTDAEGRYAVSDVAPSPLRVELKGRSLLQHAVPNWIPEGKPGATTTLDLQAARGRTLQVELRPPPELQFHGGEIEYAYAWPELVPGRRSERTLRATVPPSGTTTLRIADDIDLKLTASGRALAPRPLLAYGSKLPSKVTLTLREDGQLARPWIPIHCFDAVSSRRVQPAVILVRRADLEWAIGRNITPQVVHAVCHPADAPDFPVLDLRDLDAGEYDVWLFQPGYAPVTLRARATPLGLYPPYQVPLHPGAAAPRFEIFERGSGDPIPHAALWVDVEAKQGPFLHDFVFGGLHSGHKGVVTPPLPPGKYVVRARASGYQDGEEKVNLAGNDHLQLKLTQLPKQR
ncbi:MAG: carboxypeptidase-like regulatory domain-containing protein [Planctomycetota bacterium]|jgi:hypothetical protein